MAYHHHSFANRNLGPRPRFTQGHLPGECYGALVGAVDHVTLNSRDGSRPNPNHVYIWISVPSGARAGRYECAFSTESSGTGPDTLYLVYEEEITSTDIPPAGFDNAQLSYANLGLRESEFTRIENGSLRSAIYNWASDCTGIVVYGVTYPDGGGLHDVHMNSGERPGSAHRSRLHEDGALAFYYRHGGGDLYRRWVFIKFATQDLVA
jgi:hypothetical protein